MFRFHVLPEVAERPIATWANAIADPVLDSRHDATRCSKLPLSVKSHFALLLDLVIALRDTLGEPITVLTKLLFLALYRI